MTSPHKTLLALGQIPEEEVKLNPKATKSCESLYSNSSRGSANVVYRRKPGASNKMNCIRQPAIIPANKEIRQRVLSARRLRMKTYQNQLTDAQQTIAELAHENRILRTLHKRQDSALAKYESNNAELPQLLHSHAEELRVWQTKYKNLQATNKDLEQKLKQKESLILTLSDQNKYYIQLNKDKNLEDRQRLTEKLQALEARLQEKENDIKMMARKKQLELKQSKHQLQMEQKKSKELLMKLEHARLELSGYRKLEEIQLQEKFNINLRRNKVSSTDNAKVDPYINTTDSEAATEEPDAPNSQRSTHSTQNITQRTARTIKNVTNKNHVTLAAGSPTVIPQVSKMPVPHNRPPVALKRLEQGDGDASNAHDSYKMTNSFSLMQKQHSNLSSRTLNKTEKVQNNYEEDETENDDEGDNDNDNQEEQIDELDVKRKEIDCDESDNNGDFVSNFDESTSELDTDKDIQEYYEDTEKIEQMPDSSQKNRMKEEISCLRKQISNDYKEREAFLDTFCRQATSGALREETPKKRNSIATNHVVPNNRKHKLLAALKAIDDNKSQD
ncbi:hypothetical protein DOY81_002756 [Sarcophaga bullata]|nr:hypothetical protein DOY81_002756 [Sarcophaga bullata]